MPFLFLFESSKTRLYEDDWHSNMEDFFFWQVPLLNVLAYRGALISNAVKVVIHMKNITWSNSRLASSLLSPSAAQKFLSVLRVLACETRDWQNFWFDTFSFQYCICIHNVCINKKKSSNAFSSQSVIECTTSQLQWKYPPFCFLTKKISFLNRWFSTWRVLHGQVSLSYFCSNLQYLRLLEERYF